MYKNHTCMQKTWRKVLLKIHLLFSFDVITWKLSLSECEWWCLYYHFYFLTKEGPMGVQKKAEFMTHFIWRWFKFFAFARTHMHAHWNKSWAAQRAVNFAYISHNRYLSFVCTPSTKSREQMSQLQIQLCIKRWSWICADFFLLAGSHYPFEHVRSCMSFELAYLENEFTCVVTPIHLKILFNLILFWIFASLHSETFSHQFKNCPMETWFFDDSSVKFHSAFLTHWSLQTREIQNTLSYYK